MARTSGHSDERDREAGEAVIGRSTRVRGRVSGEGDLVIEGSLEGDVTLRGDLTIAEGGRATSTIEATAVTLCGELDGDVRASGAVRVEAGARVHGDVSGESVSIEEGAEFVGRLELAFEMPAELGGPGAGASAGRRGR
jgi:cytoskeletal protein CcmA (bactofilin family)